MIWIITAGRDDKYPRAATSDPARVFDLVLEADAFMHQCYGGEPTPLTLDMLEVPRQPGATAHIGRMVRVVALELT